MDIMNKSYITFDIGDNDRGVHMLINCGLGSSIISESEIFDSGGLPVTSPIYRTRSYAEWSGPNFEHGNA